MLKRLSTKTLKKPGSALELEAEIGSASVLVNSEAALSTILDVVKSCITGTRFSSGMCALKLPFELNK